MNPNVYLAFFLVVSACGVGQISVLELVMDLGEICIFGGQEDGMRETVYFGTRFNDFLLVL